MTSFILRLIAIITMLIDHTAAVLVPPSSPYYMPMRIIGRLAFPIFCFLLVEGDAYTRSKPRYLGRMALFALLSIIPFDMALHPQSDILGVLKREWFWIIGKSDMMMDPSPLLSWWKSASHNVFFTLSLGLIAIAAADLIGNLIFKSIPSLKDHAFFKWNIFKAVAASPVIFLCCFVADWLSSDYGWAGVMLMVIIYIFRAPNDYLSAADLNHERLEESGTAYGIHSWMMINLSPAAIVAWIVLYYMPINRIEVYAVLSVVVLLFYNRKPGPKNLKWLFYAFYPAHLLILAAIKMMMK